MAGMLKPPTDKVADFVETAVTNLIARRLGVTLPELILKLTQIEDQYCEFGSKLQSLPEARNPAINDKLMRRLYRNHMLDKRQPGRSFYERLKYSCLHCMYCLEKTVETLDHFLPQVSDPLLAITPINLIPACYRCNGNKGDDVLDDTRGLYIHPCFESLFERVWLRAKVNQNTYGEPVLMYSIDGDAKDSFSAKLINQFNKLDLATLYSKERAWDLGEFSNDLSRFFDLEGPDGVRVELQARLDSCRTTLRLSRTAMFEALVASDWYCSGGFAAYKSNGH